MNDDERDMVNELLEVEDGLTAWEVEFIEQLSHSLSEPLSERQHDKLEECWRKAFSDG